MDFDTLFDAHIIENWGFMFYGIISFAFTIYDFVEFILSLVLWYFIHYPLKNLFQISFYCLLNQSVILI